MKQVQIFNFFFQTNSNLPSSELCLEPCQTSKMEQFVKMVNGHQNTSLNLFSEISNSLVIKTSKHRVSEYLHKCYKNRLWWR